MLVEVFVASKPWFVQYILSFIGLLYAILAVEQDHAKLMYFLQ